MKKIILVASLIELIIIFILAVNVYINKDDVLGTKISINPINKEDLIFSEEGNLKYYYEPKPNNIDNKKRAWLPDGYDYAITINADSLNERFDYSFDKPQDVFRIITLGASYTYGLYVNTKDNYPERLEDLLNKELRCQNIKQFEVINLGVEGYDIEYAVQRFKKRGQKYNADLVLWLFKVRDFSRINEILLSKVVQYQKEMIGDEAFLKKSNEKGEFLPWKKKATEELAEEYDKQGGYEYKKAALQRINDYYKGKLAFVTFSTLKDSYMSALREFAKVRGGTSIYDGLTLDYDHFSDEHPNSKGYEQIAGEIFNYIKGNHLIPCD